MTLVRQNCVQVEASVKIRLHKRGPKRRTNPALTSLRTCNLDKGLAEEDTFVLVQDCLTYGNGSAQRELCFQSEANCLCYAVRELESAIALYRVQKRIESLKYALPMTSHPTAM